MGAFLQRRGYRIKVFNSIDFSKSMHYNPLAYIHNEADILKFVDALISNTKGEGKGGRPVLDKGGNAFILRADRLYHLRGPARNMNTLVDMISGMEVKEDNENFRTPWTICSRGWKSAKPDCFAVKRYKNTSWPAARRPKVF